MTQLRRLAFIGNSLPRRCGIATFTTDLQQAIAASCRAAWRPAIVAMTDHGHAYDYPPVVRLQINDDRMEDYVRAADFLNAGQFEVVSLQHEFGIFGGEAGGHIMALLSRLTMPIVTTLHTVLAEPTPAQRGVLDRIVDASSTGRRHGRERPGPAAHRLPGAGGKDRGHPARHSRLRRSSSPMQAKAKLGFSGRTVILTFGLLSPNKGIEVMIDAMPSILKSRPDAVYVVLGATHPNLVRRAGRGLPREPHGARARRSASRTTSCSSTSSSTRRRCSTSSRCATSTSRPISTRRR